MMQRLLHPFKQRRNSDAAPPSRRSSVAANPAIAPPLMHAMDLLQSVLDRGGELSPTSSRAVAQALSFLDEASRRSPPHVAMVDEEDSFIQREPRQVRVERALARQVHESGMDLDAEMEAFLFDHALPRRSSFRTSAPSVLAMAGESSTSRRPRSHSLPVRTTLVLPPPAVAVEDGDEQREEATITPPPGWDEQLELMSPARLRRPPDATRQPPHVEMFSSPTLVRELSASMLQSICLADDPLDWTYDVEMLDGASHGRCLSTLVDELVHRSDLHRRLASEGRGIDASRFVAFVRHCEANYAAEPANPYHNHRHAADVVLSMHRFLGESPGSHQLASISEGADDQHATGEPVWRFSALETLAALFAADPRLRTRHVQRA